MNLTCLQELLGEEKKYRLYQAKKVVFCDLISNWNEATVLPLNFRKKLNEKCPLNISAEILVSKNKNTVKALIMLNDGLRIETVLMKHEGGRNTVCVSSQVGCPLGCFFCATGKAGFKRNLGGWEIIEQVLFFARYLKKDGEKISSVVFMGMGEPFLNYQNVMEAIKILNDKDGFNLGARHFSISTAGIIEGIKKLTEEELQVNLAVSLHASNDEIRFRLMPVGKKYTIGKILRVAGNYVKKYHRRVMFEYIMINDLNDSKKNAEELSSLMKNPFYFVNLISYNSAGNIGDFKPSSSAKIKKFKEILEKNGVTVTQRYRFGEDIKAACGQLAGWLPGNGLSTIDNFLPRYKKDINR